MRLIRLFAMNGAKFLPIALAFAACILTPSEGFSQVDNIKRDVKKDKSSSSSRSSSSESSGDEGSSILGYIFVKSFEGLYYLGAAAQESALSHANEHPELISAEIAASAGFDFGHHSSFLQPSVKLNYGIFATEFRYAQLKDNTGKLKSIDWQVLKFRVPIQNVKLEYGMGFTNLTDMHQSYFENSLGVDWRLNRLGANVRANYRWCQNTSLDSRYREEANIAFDYEIKSHKGFHLSPMVGVAYQNYFASNEFAFIQVGVVCRFY